MHCINLQIFLSIQCCDIYKNNEYIQSHISIQRIINVILYLR